MNKEQIKQLADSSDFIPGIYNYCDRWCERCPFTARCMSYAMSPERLDEEGNRDAKNGEFWEDLSETLRATIDLIREMAQEEGVDLNAEDRDVAEEMERKSERRENTKSDPLAENARGYADMVEAWFSSHEELFRSREDELNRRALLEIPELSPAAEADSLNDAVEIVQWYHLQIYVKLMRAIDGRMREEMEELEEMEEFGESEEMEEPEDFPKDSDGSAKVALVGIDRSIAAWNRLWQHFPEEEDTILPLLVHLERLRREAERRFPEARAFVRPGFDE